MLRLFFSLFLPLLLTGCLRGSGPEVADAPASDAGTAAVASAPSDLFAAADPADELRGATSTETALSEECTGESDVAMPDDGMLDAETLADNMLLQGADQSPPDDIGETVAHQEPEFDFPIVENDKVRYFIDYFSGPGRRTFSLWLERSTRYLPMIQEIFAEYGLPLDLAYLAMVESGFNDKAYSWAHAVGPWQFIESTGKRYGLHNDWWHDERRDPVKSTVAAARFLSDLYRQFDGDWFLAVPAYNAGPGKIRTAIKKYKSRDFWVLSKGSYLQKETKNYLPKLLAALLIAKQPEAYGFEGLDYHPPLEYDTVSLPASTDLEVIARLIDADYEKLKQLNPELKRWCTPPGTQDYAFRLPPGSAALFMERYADLPAGQRANYVRHKVRSGDTLLGLAKRYGVQVGDIKRLNGIRDPRALRIGLNLIVPLNPDAGSGRAVATLKDDYQRSRRSHYTVRSGDSLWSIARRFGVSEQQLRVWNRLGWSNVIRPGQKLVVSSRSAGTPVTASRPQQQGSGVVTKMVYQVRPGDTLWGIGRQFSVATEQILAWNNLGNNHVLKPGERLTLLVRDRSSG